MLSSKGVKEVSGQHQEYQGLVSPGYHTLVPGPKYISLMLGTWSSLHHLCSHLLEETELKVSLVTCILRNLHMKLSPKSL